LVYNGQMGILDNFENAWDQEFQFESNPISETDNLGREKFWEDLGRPNNDGLALKIFKEQCCDECKSDDTGPWRD
jgi:hypothetical protein